MKEINDIVKAYKQAQINGLKTALATVVKVEGSSYRQAGARMLVTEDGQLTGAISGGCLEGDALRKALLAIHQKNNKLITYDTSNPDDVEFGVQLGCNGIVHILFEYIDENSSQNPISLLEKTIENRNESVITTLFSLEKRSKQAGTVGLVRNQNTVLSDSSSISERELLNFSSEVLEKKQNILTRLSSNEILLQYIPPQTTLIIAGAGNDVKPLVDTASILGWKTVIADGRSTHALKKRFPLADEVLLATPEEIIKAIEIDESTVFVMMTHNYNYDLALLKLIIHKPVQYIGLLGPKTRFNRMMDDLKSSGIDIGEKELNKLYGPVGIDIGAETSEEIAISVIAEIKAVLSQKKGLSLRDKPEKIHTDILSI
ncbi:XdhC and CoxI family protein [Chryseobacterium taichungense]|uniref:XdhC and CoxI family protein n=1 Tax=Chryseobacterium taichungense TaxID=295069 RepID=A0A1H7X3U8_9FLAO|nr:XdhC/CoxI family protein [Chryseobacterium taichungense]SEM28526.1 XdhC and CoxI family protein [Chryseobacterium taichungense]